jgi:hypothetical protein
MFRMDEGRARFVDAATKLLAVLAVAIGGGWTIYTYFNAREGEAHTAFLEARKPFEAKRLEIYVEAARLTATIARSHDPKELSKAKEQFWILYWGPFALVEDDKVHASMTAFGHCIVANCSASLEQLSRQVAQDCHESLGEAWGLPARPKLVSATVE